MLRKGVEETRNQLPNILDAAENGEPTIITRHGRPVAALIPFDAYRDVAPQQPLTTVSGSGKGLWGTNSADAIDTLRDEWNR